MFHWKEKTGGQENNNRSEKWKFKKYEDPTLKPDIDESIKDHPPFV